jgi:DNA-directed RNA polymerase subunit RPC12/RpoP
MMPIDRENFKGDDMIYIYKCPECNHEQEENKPKGITCPMCANYRMVWVQMLLSTRKPGEVKEKNEEVSEES